MREFEICEIKVSEKKLRLAFFHILHEIFFRDIAFFADLFLPESCFSIYPVLVNRNNAWTARTLVQYQGIAQQ